MQTLKVTISELQHGSSALRSAKQAFLEASTQMKQAANELGETWEGPARDVFIREQEQIDQWYQQMAEVVENYAAAMDKAAIQYQETDAEGAQIINRF